MRKPKDKPKTPYSRREFIGTCAAGTSLLGLSPLLTLESCTECDQVYSPFADVGDRPLISSNFEANKISVTVDFPKPLIYDKDLKIRGCEDSLDPIVDEEVCGFKLVRINKTGSLNRDGFPEIPYLGILVHVPEIVEIESVSINPGFSAKSYGLMRIYPSQSDYQDNMQYIRNYSKYASINQSLYDKLTVNTPSAVGDEIDDVSIAPHDRWPEDIIAMEGPYYYGYSRYYVLKILPFYFQTFQDVSNGLYGGWFFKKTVSVDINLHIRTILPDNKDFETPYLPISLDNSPIHERIIDPWKSPVATRILFENIKPNNPEHYQLIGPELIILYQTSNEKDKDLKDLAQDLLEHKLQVGFSEGVIAAVENPDELSTQEGLQLRFNQIINSYEDYIDRNKTPIWRLNSIILLGDIKGINNQDLYSQLCCSCNPTTGTSTEEGTDSGSDASVTVTPCPSDDLCTDKRYFSDFNCSAPYNTSQIQKRWPNISVGRIPVNTQSEALQVILNIKQFDGYQKLIRNNLTLVSYFQDTGKGSTNLDGEASRDYLECSEEVRLCLDRNLINVNMLYQSENNVLRLSKLKHRDGIRLDCEIKFLESDILKKEIRKNLREGEGILFHRDHGWMNGWSHPNFKIPDLWKADGVSGSREIRIAKPKIVFSINCLTGRFVGENFGSSGQVDSDETCTGETNSYSMPKCSNISFAEALIKGVTTPHGEYVDFNCPAVVSSTEISPSFENDWLAKIMFDKIYGGILTEREVDLQGTRKTRIGLILNEAKMLLHAYHGDRCLHFHENLVFHILGDPTLEI